jgi:hypothetical protein
VLVDVTDELIAGDIEDLRSLAHWDGFARALFDYMEKHPDPANPNFDVEAARRRWRRTARKSSLSLRLSINRLFLNGVYEDTDCYDPPVEGREIEPPEPRNPGGVWSRLLLTAIDPTAKNVR